MSSWYTSIMLEELFLFIELGKSGIITYSKHYRR